MKDFRQIKVWGKAHDLTIRVYQVTSTFPKDEMYGLTNQIRRASSSTAANIAEGCGRGGSAEFARFLQVAMGSANDLEYHLLLAHDLTMLEDADYYALSNRVIEIKRMLASYIQKGRRIHYLMPEIETFLMAP